MNGAYGNAQKAYQNSIYTASPAELTLMLYNGAIKFCNLAFEAFEKKDIEAIHNNIIKVENIIEEFIVTLDDQYEISNDYKRLYQYIYELLVEANTHKDIEKLKEAKDFIIQFRDMWKLVIVEAKKHKEAK